MEAWPCDETCNDWTLPLADERLHRNGPRVLPQRDHGLKRRSFRLRMSFMVDQGKHGQVAAASIDHQQHELIGRKRKAIRMVAYRHRAHSPSIINAVDGHRI